MNPMQLNTNILGGSPLNQAIASQPPAQPPNQSQPQSGSQPNWLEKLLPTAGGILGGIGGAFIPGLGETGLGEAGGAAAGGAAGKALENALTGQKDLTSGVGASAVENGVGQLAGAGIVKAGGALLGGATDALSGAAANRAAQTATDMATTDAAKTVSDQAAQAQARAEAFKNNYGSISGRLQTDLKLGTNARTVDAMGYDSTNPADMKTVSNAGLDLNNVYDQALQGAKPVDMSGFGTKIYSDMQKNGVTDLGTTPLGKAISEAQIPLNEKNLQLPATQVRKLQQSIGTQIGNTQKLINNSELQGVSNTEAEAQLKNLQDTYQDLGNRIKTPEVNAAIAKTSVSDADRSGLVAKYGDTLGNHVADTINNAKSADDLLKPMQSYTQMSHAADMAQNDIDNAIATPRAVARTKADLSTSPAVATTPTGSGTGVLDALSLGGAPFTHGFSLLGLVPHVISAAKSPAVQDAALTGLTKVTGSKTAGKVVPALIRSGAIATANLPNDVSQPGATVPSAIPGQTPNGGGAMQPQSPLDQYIQQQSQLQGNLATQEAMAPLDLAPSLSGAISSLGANIGSQIPQANQQALAAPVIDRVQSAMQNAGGAQGPLGGLLTQATSLIPGSPANAFNQSQEAAAASLGKLLGITPQAAMALLPKLTQSSQTAGNALGTVNGVLGGMGQSGSAIPAQ